MRKKAFLAAAALTLWLTASAQESIVYNGIYYKLLGGNRVEVVTEKEAQGGGSSISIGFGGGYEGDVVIPATFDYDGVEYTVTSVGVGAFAYSKKLTSVTLPATITNITEGAFAASPNLAFIAVPEEDSYYCTVDGVLYSRDMSLLMACPGSKTGEYEVPATVSVIAWSAFNGCQELTKISLPSSLAYISANAFRECSSLQEMTIPNEVNIIEDGTFYGCYQLTTLTLPSSLTTIGTSAFYYCRKLTSIELPSTVTTIGEKAFEDCSSLQQVILPDGLTTIGDRAFTNCSSLTTFDIPAHVSHIGAAPFSGCSMLSAINVDEANAYYASVGGVLFDHDLTRLINCPPQKSGTYTIPSTVKKVDASAFYQCRQLTDITLPPTLDSIAASAFLGCNQLREVKLPATLKYIGARAFSSCNNVESFTSYAITCPTIDQSTFITQSFNLPLYVPGHYKSKYTKHSIWKQFKKATAIIEEAGIATGKTFPGIPSTLTLSTLHAETVLKGLTYRFRLPEGVSLDTDDEGMPVCQLDDRFSGASPVTTFTLDDGCWTMSITFDGENPIIGNEGRVATLSYTAASDMDEGELVRATI